MPKKVDLDQVPSSFSAMIQAKCPRCREGKMFVGSTYSFKKQRFNDICPHCGLKFEIEPGYFYAAMYVSYGLVVAQTVIVGVLSFLLLKSESPLVYIGILLITILAFAPFNFRYSRLILLHYLTPRVGFNMKYRNPDSLKD